MPNFAQATIIGHLGRDPELRHTPSGNAVCDFSVATSKKRGGDETTTWWRVSLWGKRGELVAQYLNKGDPICVSGEPYLREYTGRDGDTKYALELDARDFAFISSAGRQHHSPETTDYQSPPKDDGAPINDDIPF